MKIYGFVRKDIKCLGHGDYREIETIILNAFFKNKKVAEKYLIENNKKVAGEKREWLLGVTIKEFELIEK